MKYVTVSQTVDKPQVDWCFIIPTPVFGDGVDGVEDDEVELAGSPEYSSNDEEADNILSYLE